MLKNGLIRLKFATLIPWVNTWGCFFIFRKFWFLGPGDHLMAQKLWSSLESPKIRSDLAEIWHTLVPWVNIWGYFFQYLKFFIFGPWGQVFVQNQAKNFLDSRESPKMIGFGWNLVNWIRVNIWVCSLVENLYFHALMTSLKAKKCWRTEVEPSAISSLLFFYLLKIQNSGAWIPFFGFSLNLVHLFLVLCF